MKPKSSLWKIVPLLAVVVIIIAAVLIFKKPANQEAALYKATAQTQAVLAAQSTGTFGAQSPSAPTPGPLFPNATPITTPISPQCRVTSNPFIKVLSPNGGEVFTTGQTMAIKWNGCKYAGQTVQIAIRDARFSSATTAGEGQITMAAPNTGSYQWVIPQSQGQLSGGTVGGTSVYSIIIYATGSNGAMFDESDGRFTINPTVACTTGITAGSSPTTPSIWFNPPTGSQVHGTVHYGLPFSVTACNQTVFIPKNLASVAVVSATNQIQFCIDATTSCTSGAVGVLYDDNSPRLTPSLNGNFQIPAGQTRRFIIDATYQPAAAIITRAKLLNINWSLYDASSPTAGNNPWNVYTTGMGVAPFVTPAISAY
jgi:hypothetical protein